MQHTRSPGWHQKHYVDYVQKSFKDPGALKADGEFVNAYRLYPTILPPT